MLEAARRDAAAPGLTYRAGTIESFDGLAEWDLIFSNAAFHWVENHDALIRRLHAALTPGGQLAFQLPAMHHGTSHSLPDQLAQESPFREAFGGWTRPQPVLEPEDYARLLFRVGFSEPKVRLIIYPHVLESRDAVVEWMKGTLLTEYEKRLTPEQYGDFVAAFRARLLPQLSADRPFLFPFRRILCWGRKADG
jgi:trans-aconitate 2-methyltransferase